MTLPESQPAHLTATVGQAGGAVPPAPPKSPSGFAVAALLVGIGAFLFGLVPVFGAIVGIAGVVLGALALSKGQSKGMAIAGLVLGGLAILSSIGVTAGLGVIANNASDSKPPMSLLDNSSSDVPDETASPVEEEAQEEPAVAEVPAEFKSALIKAESYSENLHMSKAAIYDQLVSEYGEQFTPEAAQYGIDNMDADWNANALAKAQSYQDSMAMSPAAIYDQLISEYGEKFTPEEADYAIAHLND